jgi:hypothetical protein
MRSQRSEQRLELPRAWLDPPVPRQPHRHQEGTSPAKRHQQRMKAAQCHGPSRQPRLGSAGIARSARDCTMSRPMLTWAPKDRSAPAGRRSAPTTPASRPYESAVYAGRSQTESRPFWQIGPPSPRSGIASPAEGSTFATDGAKRPAAENHQRMSRTNEMSCWPVQATAGQVARLSIRMGLFLGFFLALFLELFPYPGPLAQLVELRTFNP